jgi:hypothetical protein
MPRMMFTRARRSIFVLVAAVAMAGALAGCMREDQGGEGMTIWNQTSATVDVNYRRTVGTTEIEDLIMTVPSGQRVNAVGPHQAEGECIRGTLVAILDGRTIATLSQPCRGAEWVIKEPEVPPSPAPSS